MSVLVGMACGVALALGLPRLVAWLPEALMRDIEASLR